MFVCVRVRVRVRVRCVRLFSCVYLCMCMLVCMRVCYLHDLRQTGVLLGGEQAGVQVATVAVRVRVVRGVCRGE